MSLFSALSHLAEEWRAARTAARTYRIIGSLPHDLQKDIGWPDIHRIDRPRMAVGPRGK